MVGSDEMLAVLLCDGHDKIPSSFKSYAREHGFYDEQALIEDGYTNFVDGACKMRRIDESGQGEGRDYINAVAKVFANKHGAQERRGTAPKGALGREAQELLDHLEKGKK